MDSIDDFEEEMAMDISPLIPITEFLIEIRQMNPQISWEDLMYNCIFAGGYMAKYNKMTTDDYLKILRSIKIISEDIPNYHVGEA